MTDLKSMFNKLSGKQTEKAASSNGTASIEQTYQKKSQLEHILLRPDTYIGSVEANTESMWVFDEEKKHMVNRQIKFVPGLYKIFDEILVNAADNKQRDKNMDCIKIDIVPEENKISVWNNGQGIPVVMHKEEKMYVPTMIFGHLLTSSNYNDEEAKVTGGRNGYGAKLCNIFSDKFTVETSTREYKRKFKQTWTSNMGKTSEPSIADSAANDYTKITFYPDLTKFKMESLDDDIVALMKRRAYDIAASSRGVKVFLNGERLPVKNFKDYIELYTKGVEEDTPKVIYESCNERWEVAFAVSHNGFQQVSFVNSIATTKGGRHVDYVTDMMIKKIQEVLNKKNKGGVAVRPNQIRDHMWIFVNCLIVNPAFSSQTKEHMTTLSKNFGSKAALTEKFITSVVKSGVVESVLSWARFKAQSQLNKAGGAKKTKIKGIPKLEDANEAGGRNALRCTLILTEGDSAKTLAVSGLGVIGRDYYGVFPLRGKLLNVREATHKQLLENAEINNLVKIIGLQYKKKYSDDDDMRTLRYGKVMIMTDQDQDGSHIKGLLINFIHYNWPELLRRDFLEEFITPIVKVTRRNEEIPFYSMPEFEEWRLNTPNHKSYSVKYYKGLGTSTSKEAKEYFTNMARHRIRFKYSGPRDDDHIMLAFSKKHIEHRKEWLTNFMVEARRVKELDLPVRYLYMKDTKFISYTDFVNLELVLYSNADNIRSIPCMVDGFKPGHRKVLYTCIKRNDKKEVKVAQLAGAVAEKSAYHHGEVSLCMTIVGMAQNFVGSNNINLLEPRGQFGTRLAGGKDSASPRYIFTKMSPLTRMLFHPHDDPLLTYEYDDNLRIEPTWYCPIIPTLLVNGADGIGTGWATKIPNYNPRDIVANIRMLMKGEDPPPMKPWYKNFKGTIEDAGDLRFVTSGEIALLGDHVIEISELPIGCWTQNYKESVLEPLMNGEKVKAVISDYKEYNTDTTVRFVVTIIPAEFANVQKDGFHKVFKLQSSISLSSMCVFDELGCLKRVESVDEIMQDFYKLRLDLYTKRKDYLEGNLQAEANKLSNQARFIVEKCDGSLVVENKKRKVMVEELIKLGYQADPVAAWRELQKNDEEDAQEEADDNPAAASEATESKRFDYLLGMSFWMLTEERKRELLRQRDEKIHELKTLQAKTNLDLWREDLDVFMKKLDEVEEQERIDEMGVKTEGKKKVAMPKKKQLQLASEAMPSPKGKRIAPTITDEMRKKFAAARAGKAKQTATASSVDAEADEFDNMVKESKPKLRTPADAVAKGKKRAKKGSDGMKQTKLNFSKKAATNGKKKKNSDDFSDDDGNSDAGSEDEVSFTITSDTPVRDKPQRNVARKVYNLDSEDEDGFESDDAPRAKPAATKPKEKSPPPRANSPPPPQPAAAISIDSDDDQETSPPPKPNESSEDLFDQMVGKTPPSPVIAQKAPAGKRKLMAIDVSDGEAPAKAKRGKPKKPTEKGSGGDGAKKPRKPPAKKKKNASSDSDSDFKVGDKIDSNTDGDSPIKPAGRAVRNIKKPVFTFSDSDESF